MRKHHSNCESNGEFLTPQEEAETTRRLTKKEKDGAFCLSQDFLALWDQKKVLGCQGKLPGREEEEEEEKGGGKRAHQFLILGALSSTDCSVFRELD